MIPTLIVGMLWFRLVTGNDDYCPWYPDCCEEDCCGPGTSWLSGRCESDPGSVGWIPPHSPEHSTDCGPRRCCENTCCGEGLYYDPTTAFCYPTEGTYSPSESPPTNAPSSGSSYTHIRARMLCIYSKVARDVGSPSAGAGHAAISLYDGTNYPPNFKLTTVSFSSDDAWHSNYFFS